MRSFLFVLSMLGLQSVQVFCTSKPVNKTKVCLSVTNKTNCGKLFFLFLSLLLLSSCSTLTYQLCNELYSGGKAIGSFFVNCVLHFLL